MSKVEHTDARDGVAKIKTEFLVSERKRKIDVDFLPPSDKNDLVKNNDTKEPPKKKLRGQNKRRPREIRVPRNQKLCSFVINDKECPYSDRCHFSHDVTAYMSKKPADINENCHIFEEFGRCKYGVTCRFGRSHTSEKFTNVIKEKLWKEKQLVDDTKNNLGKDLLHTLRKRIYDFSVSEKVLKDLNKQKSDAENRKNVTKKQDTNDHREGKNNTSDDVKPTGNADILSEKVVEDDIKPIKTENVDVLDGKDIPSDDKPNENVEVQDDKDPSPPDCVKPIKAEKSDILKDGNATNSDKTTENTDVFNIEKDDHPENPKETKTLGCVTDEGLVKVRKEEIKLVDFSNKLYLAPLTTVGNLPFRRICKRYGADITCGEMAMATNILQGYASEWALVKRHECEDVFGVQLCGAHADTMTKCAQLLVETTDIDFIDINVGCPIDLVYKKGAGCALMDRRRKFEDIIRSMKSVMNVPLTVKLRTGVYSGKNTAHQLIPHLRDYGVDAVTLHGRSREQRYTRQADWDYINECAQLAHPMPLIGCGDVLTYEDYNLRKETSKVDAIMIARGALFKPWIFKEIKEERHWDISSQERLDMLKDYVNYGLEQWGSDHEGVEKTRRFLLEWLSFLYRYIPVGLLEKPPQKINERPPHYFGRNDLETLMASPNCADWVKISEMLLGPVPEEFSFLPKHKANSYNST